MHESSLPSKGAMKAEAQAAGRKMEGLIAYIAAGDRSAFVELYSQVKTAVYSFAFSILRNKHDAEDVMQEAFVKIHNAAASYLPNGKPMAWILTIVKNESLMKLRAQKRWEPLPDEERKLPAATGQEDASVNRLVLNEALAILSDEERQIVFLYSVSGLKHREIAALLQLPLSTTLSKYRRALSKLKKQLKEDM